MINYKKCKGLLVFVVPLLLLGCAHLARDFEQPSVKLVSLRALPSEGMEQRFAIGLKITNPNGVSLSPVGMSYRLSLRGYDLLSGVTDDIPEIQAYSEIPVVLNASVNLLNSLRLVQSLLSQPEQNVDYELAAKLELTSRLLPALRIVEKGEINLSR